MSNELCTALWLGQGMEGMEGAAPKPLHPPGLSAPEVQHQVLLTQNRPGVPTNLGSSKLLALLELGSRMELNGGVLPVDHHSLFPCPGPSRFFSLPALRRALCTLLPALRSLLAQMEFRAGMGSPEGGGNPDFRLCSANPTQQLSRSARKI